MTLPPPPSGEKIYIAPKGSKKEKTYIWMPDAKGNLVKAEASTVKKGFTKLPIDSQILLSEYLIGTTNRASTTSSRQQLWNDIIDGAVASFKDGKKETPWDVLAFMTKNTPPSTGVTSSIVEYDEITANATLNKIAKDSGFDLTLITDADRADFLAKINAEASQSGKTTVRKATTGGYESVTTPSMFNAREFTESFLWAKVNVGDTTTLPSTAIKQIANVKTLLKNYGINNLSSKEINQYSIDVASGSKTLDEVMLDFSEKAQKLYPIYAPRLAANPKLNMSDIAEPVISTLSKVWEKDPTAFDLSDPEVMQFLIPDVTGKAPEVSIANVYKYAMNHPNREKTKAANDDARSMATGVLSAMGFGV